jgi:adenosylcobinamide kinase/adenosylcobinamide-phosphate guanylyltransferase
MSTHNQSSVRVKRLILILGGARSGKSAYAEELAQRMAAESPALPLIYVATATAADDEEMRQRIARHRSSRGTKWVTVEESTDPAGALKASGWLDKPGVVLVDCLTLLVANVLVGGSHPGEDTVDPDFDNLDVPAAEERVKAVVADLLAANQQSAGSLILVSNEVGMGVVPPYLLGRIFRDVLGRVNAEIAEKADAVIFMLSGLPIELKSLADAWRQAAAERLGLDH